jgi:hypothetical protein
MAPASCPRPRIRRSALGLPHKRRHLFELTVDGDPKAGELVGAFDEQDGRPVFQVLGIGVRTKYARCGLGTKLYEAAARFACTQGAVLQSDFSRTPKSQGFWAKQTAKGRAVCAVPVDPDIQLDITQDGPDYGRGGCGAYQLKACPAPRSLAGGLGAIRNPEDVRTGGEARVAIAEHRARAAGAEGELEYLGMGGEGTVLCDAHGQAFKVAHRGASIADEAAWLEAANQVPGVREHVAKFIRYDAANEVLVRACPQPYVTPRGERRRPPTGHKLAELHEEIGRRMRAYGWGRPEYKPDAYVLTRRGPVLVDAGFAVRRGRVLAAEALAIANGRKRAKPIDVLTLSWEVRAERGDTLPKPIADRILRRLKALNPEVDLDF